MGPRIEQFSCFKGAGSYGTSYTNSHKPSHTSRQRGKERELPGSTGTRSSRAQKQLLKGAQGRGPRAQKGRA